MKQQPLLMTELTDVERVSLMSLAQQPGYAVLEKMHMAACKRATDAVIQLDPTEEGYERKLKALQSKARERNEFSLLILGSVSYHMQVEEVRNKELEAKPQANPILKGQLK